MSTCQGGFWFLGAHGRIERILQPGRVRVGSNISHGKAQQHEGCIKAQQGLKSKLHFEVEQ